MQEDVPLPAKGPSRTRLETHSLETRPGGAPWHRRSDCWLVGHPNPHCHSALSAPFRYARRRVAVWVALPLGPERAAPRGRHCHSGPSAPSWYVRRRVAVWVALPLGPERAVPCVHRRVAVHTVLRTPPGVLVAPPAAPNELRSWAVRCNPRDLRPTTAGVGLTPPYSGTRCRGRAA